MQLCRECRRHIKITPCPFCGGTAVEPTAQQVSTGLSRAQILAGVALAGAIAAGCTDKQTPPASSTTSSSSGGAESTAAVYGAPAFFEPDAAAVEPMAPAYGAPPTAPAVVDAGRMNVPSPAGAYGAPPAH